MGIKSLSMIFLFVFGAVLVSPGSSQTPPGDGAAECAAARDLYIEVEPVDRVYEELTRAEYVSTCGLTETCCSEEVERNFSMFAVQDLRQTVQDMWQQRQLSSNCSISSFKDEFVRFIEITKQDLLDLLKETYQQYFTQLTLFDRFFDYLKNAVYTGNICNIGVEFNTLYFEVFLSVLRGHPNLDRSHYRFDDRSFSQCLYDYNVARMGEKLNNQFVSLTRSFNRTLYYFRALDTAEELVRLVSDLQMTPQCQQAVMRTTYCAQCGGQSANVQPCRDLCLNAIRGCVVDYTDVVEPYVKFIEAAIRMKEHLEATANPFTHISQFTFNFLLEANDIIVKIVTINEQILTRCVGDNFNNRNRRHADLPNKQIFTRSITTTAPPYGAFNNSAYCLRNIAPLFTSIPDTICTRVSADNSTSTCWNGDKIGRYERETVGFTREEQHNNPELIVCNLLPQHIRVQLSHLKRVTQELNVLTHSEECPEDDEDCVVDLSNTCNFRSYRPVHSNVTLDQPSVDQEEVEIFSGSGCRGNTESGSGSGDGSGDGDIDIEIDEIDEIECTTTTKLPECLAPIKITTTTTNGVSSSSQTITKTSTTQPVATPTPKKEPPIIIQALPAGTVSHVPSSLLLLLLFSLAVLQSVL